MAFAKVQIAIIRSLKALSLLGGGAIKQKQVQKLILIAGNPQNENVWILFSTCNLIS
jgi:hypothetical protein